MIIFRRPGLSLKFEMIDNQHKQLVNYVNCDPRIKNALSRKADKTNLSEARINQ